MSTHETKVIAAGAGAPFGLALAGYANWQLGVLAFGASTDAAKATEAVQAVPAPLSVLLGLLITGGVAYLAGWLAPHTPRPDPEGGHADLTTVLTSLAVAIVVVTVYALAVVK